MTKRNTVKYAEALEAARKAGGNPGQSHWLGRLKAVMKKRAASVKKAKAER